jgi:hypothetical protein
MLWDLSPLPIRLYGVIVNHRDNFIFLGVLYALEKLRTPYWHVLFVCLSVASFSRKISCCHLSVAIWTIWYHINRIGHPPWWYQYEECRHHHGFSVMTSSRWSVAILSNPQLLNARIIGDLQPQNSLATLPAQVYGAGSAKTLGPPSESPRKWLGLASHNSRATTRNNPPVMTSPSNWHRTRDVLNGLTAWCADRWTVGSPSSLLPALDLWPVSSPLHYCPPWICGP